MAQQESVGRAILSRAAPLERPYLNAFAVVFDPRKHPRRQESDLTLSLEGARVDVGKSAHTNVLDEAAISL
jgi:hypothetical protein